MEARTSLVNTARGLAKSLGERLPICDTDQMGVEQTESLPAELQHVLEPLLAEVVSLTEKILGAPPLGTRWISPLTF